MFFTSVYSGGFDDSLVYYEQAIYIWNNGLLEGLSSIYHQTNKFEIGMGLIFLLAGVFGGGAVCIYSSKFVFGEFSFCFNIS